MSLGRNACSFASQPAWMLAVAFFLTLLSAAGCGHSEGQASNATITLGREDSAKEANAPQEASPAVVPASALNSNSDGTFAAADKTAEPNGTVNPADSKAQTISNSAASESKDAPPTAEGTRTFKLEGPEDAIRISYDDFDLLKVLNLDPVPKDALEKLPKWLKALDGKRIRVRGFMYPPFQDTGIRGFVLARDNQICCFGRTPKEYDLVDTFLRKGVTTSYIQNRPFDVVGIFRIKSEIEKFTAMYELEDAIVIEK